MIFVEQAYNYREKLHNLYINILVHELSLFLLRGTRNEVLKQVPSSNE